MKDFQLPEILIISLLLWPVFCVFVVGSSSLTSVCSMQGMQDHKPWQFYAMLQLHSLFKNLHGERY